MLAWKKSTSLRPTATARDSHGSLAPSSDTEENDIQGGRHAIHQLVSYSHTADSQYKSTVDSSLFDIACPINVQSINSQPGIAPSNKGRWRT